MPASRRSFVNGTLSALASWPAVHAFAQNPVSPIDDEPDSPKFLDPAKLKANAQPGDIDTLFFTWFHDPCTTMVVQWIGLADEFQTTDVHFGINPIKPPGRMTYRAIKKGQPATAIRTVDQLLQPIPIEYWQTIKPITKPFAPNSDLKVFRAEMTGLLPDTMYRVQIGNRPATYRFRTMPTKITNSFSFISGGDCGVNIHATNNNFVAATQDPSFAIIGGDLGYDNGKSIDVAVNFLRQYHAHMVARGGRSIPLVTCIGNHEVEGGYNAPREKAPFYYALFDGLYPDHGFARLDFGNYLSLILLDTNHTTPIEGQQTHWLEQQLRSLIDHPHVLPIYHVPAYPSNRAMASTGVAQRALWSPLFDRYRVPCVCEHHDHTFKRSKPLLDGMVNPKGVVYLGDGSWGRLRTPLPPEKIPLLDRTSRHHHITLHRLEDEDRYHLALDEFGKVGDVAHTRQRSTLT